MPRTPRWLLVVAALKAIGWALPARVEAAPAPALMRFMLASSKFYYVILQIDEQLVLEQPSNIMSDPLAIDPERAHTLVVLGLESTNDEDGATLIRRITNYCLAAGSFAISIFADDGTEHRTAPAPQTPADKSLLAPMLAAPAICAAALPVMPVKWRGRDGPSPRA